MTIIFYTLASCLLGIFLYLGIVRLFRFANHPFQFIQDNLVYYILVCLSVLFILSTDFVDLNEMNYLLQTIYSVLVFVSLIFLVVVFIRFSAQRNSLDRIFFIVMSIPLLIVIGLGIIIAIVEVINRSEGSIFYVIIIFLIVFSYLLLEEFRLLEGTLSDKVPPILRFILSTLCVYILLNGFILIVFGYYNLKFGLSTLEIDPNTASIVQTMLAGGSFFFQFPSLETELILNVEESGLYATILQYFIGLFVNLLVLPFFISYYSSRISNHQRVEQIPPQEVIEYNNIGEGI